MSAATAAIKFALETDDGLTFLHYWNTGEFDVLRREWPDCPEDVFEGVEVKSGHVYFYRAQAYSVECPHCEFELTGIMGDPSGKEVECDECSKKFIVSKGATAVIF